MVTDERFFLSAQEFEPAYLALHRSGELARRACEAVASLEHCTTCPRNCGANRLAGHVGTCKIKRYAVVSSAFPHMGEEDCLRGWRGSGTIFFSGCSLRCVFCQNYDISHTTTGQELFPEQLASSMLALQDAGCHNINFVTPDHVVPQILEALDLAAADGLRLPLVYNTSGYCSPNSLAWLDGVVDIYMPDFKTASAPDARQYLQAKDYPEVALNAIREMHRQVGDLCMDENGIARRGVLVRHLVMPAEASDTRNVMRLLAEISTDLYVNIMGQYHPDGKVSPEKYADINRSPTRDELSDAYQAAQQAGLWRFDK